MALSKIDPAGLDIGQIGGRRNLIINGAQTVDQRFGGSSELKGSGAKYHTDRFVVYSQAASKITAQQVSEAPAGFKNSLQLTVTNSVTLGATDQYMLQQRLEGQNVANLAFGTSSAETVTLSFYVRSSLTGTHSGVLVNGSENRNYPFTYTISTADTWERVSVTIAGDTTGTWTTTNAVGMWVKWNLGTGSTYLGTAGAWSGTSYLSGATGSVQLIETSSATFYLTGVQLEAGDTATPFEHRSYGEELALCQRYFVRLTNTAQNCPIGSVMAYANGTIWGFIRPYPQPMRATPTPGQSGNFNFTDRGSAVTVTGSINNLNCTDVGWFTGGWGTGSNLSAGEASVIQITTTGKLDADAEL